MNQTLRPILVASVMAVFGLPARADIDTGEFTYQGQIKLNGLPVTDLCDFSLSLWDSATSTAPADQVGPTLTFDGIGGNAGPVDVVNGFFSVMLDFGPEAFTDEARWLEVAVRCPAGVGDYSILSPRERMTGAPYAIHTRGIFVDDAGNVGIGSDNPREKLEVHGNIAIVDAGLDPYLELQADTMVMRLRALDGTGFAVTDDRDQPHMVVGSRGEGVGIGTTRPEALLHVTGAGRFRGNHIAYFESNSGPASDGIAIQLSNPHTNRENNFITFYNGDRLVTGRIEGFDREFGDWIAPPPIPDVGLTFDPGISYNEDWYTPGTLPSLSFSPGSLPTVNFSAGSLPTANFAPGTLPSVNFTPGTLPTLSFSPGTLPTANFTPGTLPSVVWDDGSLPSFSGQYCNVVGISVLCGFSWSAGSTPTLSFSAGTLPSLTFNGGSLPSATFNGGSLPTLNFTPGTLPSLTFNGGSLPSLNFSGGSLPSASLNRGTLPRIEKPPFLLSPPVLSFDPPTREELEALYCWALENGHTDVVQLDPVSIAMANLRQQVAASCKDEGVTYGSKGADYAEYLPKMNPSDQFQLGQIVGVHGGKVSLKTEGAEQIMAISRAPVVVGNVPPDSERHNFVTVGFMGQLPVVVRGKVFAGDYIIPSGREDGTAKAVRPENLTIDHIGRTLGRAWSESENNLYSLINVAIGLNGYEEKVVLQEHQRRLDSQTSRLEGLVSENARLKGELASMEDRMESLVAAVRALEDQAAAGSNCDRPVAMTGSVRP